MSGQLVRATLVAIVICVLSSGIVQAQSPAPNIQNTNKSSDISLRSNLRVNPSTLALEFDVSLGNYPGRGGLDVPVTLQYSSKVWRIAYQSYTPSIQVSFDGQYKEGFTSLSAQYSGGWTSSVGFPVMLYDEFASRFNSSGMPLPETTDCDHMACYRIDRVMIRMPDNSVHELRSSDEPYIIGNGFSLPSPAPDDLYAVDGTGMRYQRSTQTLFLADGSRYIFSSTAPRYIDANGNTLTYTGDSAYNLQNNIDLGLTDSLGRSIPPFRKANGSNRDDVYSLPGVNGVPLNYTFKWRHLGDAGVMTTPQSLNYVADFGCPSAAGEEPPVGGAPSLFLSDSAGRSFICNPETFNPTLLYQIVLPTDRLIR